MASDDNIVKLKHLPPFANGISFPNGDNVVRLKHLVSLASAIADETIDSSSKQIPNLSIGDWSIADTVYSAPVLYDGDGELSVNVGSISNGTLTVSDADGNFSGLLTASAGQSFAPAVSSFTLKTKTVYSGGGKTIPELTVDNWSGLSAPITYTGDGELGVVGGTLDNTVLTASNSSGIIYARETDNFAAVITDWEPPVSSYLVANLPFSTFVTEDLSGNTWTTYGTPTLSDSALYLNGSSYLQRTGGIDLGEQDFTICGWFNMSSSIGSNARIVMIYNTADSVKDAIFFGRNYENNAMLCRCISPNNTLTPSCTKDAWHHFELNYSHSSKLARLFLDGVLKGTLSTTIARTHFNYCYIGKMNYANSAYFKGSIDDFKIYDGIALHTANFTPPGRAS